MRDITGVEILIKYQSVCGKTLNELREFVGSNKEFKEDIGKLAEKVVQFTSSFDMPGNENI